MTSDAASHIGAFSIGTSEFRLFQPAEGAWWHLTPERHAQLLGQFDLVTLQRSIEL
jgi:hypothetical protein